MRARGAAVALLVADAVLLACTAPVIAFLVLWGSVWEGSPSALAHRRTAVRWLLASGVANAVAFGLVVLAASQAKRHQARPAVTWATAWVAALAVTWSVALGPTVWPVALLLAVPVLLARILLLRPEPAQPGPTTTLP